MTCIVVELTFFGCARFLAAGGGGGVRLWMCGLRVRCGSFGCEIFIYDSLRNGNLIWYILYAPDDVL